MQGTPQKLGEEQSNGVEPSFGARCVLPRCRNGVGPHARGLGSRLRSARARGPHRASSNSATTSGGACIALPAIASVSPVCRSGSRGPSGSMTTTSTSLTMFGRPRARPSPISRDRCCPRRSGETRPLWELWIADKLDDGRIGVRGQGASLHGRRDRRRGARPGATRSGAQLASRAAGRVGARRVARFGARAWWTGWSTGRATSWHWPGRPRGSQCHRRRWPAV